jgi:4-diphosphocytidyl-2-C-methyl-D-erythritol kinase
MRPARAVAAAKVNLALVVGERRDDGLHELASILQRVDVCDRIELEQARGLTVEGFKDDTIVRRALEELGREAQVDPAWRVRITKEIPVAAGLGGGSADAAAALRLANASLEQPLAGERLHGLAARLGADVPFFLASGPKLAEGAGEQLTSLDIPQDFWVLLALPPGATKPSTGAVYARFDELGGSAGFGGRRAALRSALEEVRRPRDLAALPANDLSEASGGAPLADELRAAGAFRADLSGAGPTVYGLFNRREDARAAARGIGRRARTWVVAPVW